MIRSWANVVSRRFFEEGTTSKFRGMDHETAQDLLGALDAATDLKDLSPLKSVGLHKLKGNRKGHGTGFTNDLQSASNGGDGMGSSANGKIV